MKYFNPKGMKPNTNQFHEVVKGRISDTGQQSIAYRAVASLFEQAQSIYRTLGFVTEHNLAHFKDGKYLTQLQERDSVALTAMYVGNLKTQFFQDVVKRDTTISDQERLVLEMALEVYRTSSESNYATLGNPRWIEE